MTTEQAFWNWFVAHEEDLLYLDASRERLFDSLHLQITQVHPDLVFEFGPRAEQREFVISADGLRNAFSAVAALVASAPRLDRWRITGFRPRRSPLNPVQIGDVTVDPADIEFSLLTDGSTIGLKLFIPGFGEEKMAIKQIVYLMLDEALGEYDVETKIGLIQMLPPESPTTPKRYPLSELPARFDELSARLTKPVSTN
jgi:hypothetical protein